MAKLLVKEVKSKSSDKRVQAQKTKRASPTRKSETKKVGAKNNGDRKVAWRGPARCISIKTRGSLVLA